MCEIRPANCSEDVDALVQLGHLLHAESPTYRDLPYSPRRARDALQTACRSGIVMVAEVDGRIVGGMAVVLFPHWSLDLTIAGELSLFVHPEYRGGLTAMRLIRAAMRRARDLGADVFQAGTTTGVNAERVARLYERLGFTRLSSIGLEFRYGH